MKFSLTDQQKSALSRALQEKGLPWPLRRRLEIIRLLDSQTPVSRICRYLEITDTSVTHYARVFQQEGIAGLLQRKQKGHKGKLTDAHLRALQQKQAEKRGRGERWSLAQRAAWLKETFGLVITTRSLYRRLRPNNEDRG